jgi:hypothetical protein
MSDFAKVSPGFLLNPAHRAEHGSAVLTMRARDFSAPRRVATPLQRPEFKQIVSRFVLHPIQQKQPRMRIFTNESE